MNAIHMVSYIYMWLINYTYIYIYILVGEVQLDSTIHDGDDYDYDDDDNIITVCVERYIYIICMRQPKRTNNTPLRTWSAHDNLLRTTHEYCMN